MSPRSPSGATPSDAELAIEIAGLSVLNNQLQFTSDEANKLMPELTLEQIQALASVAHITMPTCFSTISLLIQMAGISYDEAVAEISNILNGRYPDYAFDYDDIDYAQDIRNCHLKKWHIEKLISPAKRILILNDINFMAEKISQVENKVNIYQTLTDETFSLLKAASDSARLRCLSVLLPFSINEQDAHRLLDWVPLESLVPLSYTLALQIESAQNWITRLMIVEKIERDIAIMKFISTLHSSTLPNERLYFEPARKYEYEKAIFNHQVLDKILPIKLATSLIQNLRANKKLSGFNFFNHGNQIVKDRLFFNRNISSKLLSSTNEKNSVETILQTIATIETQKEVPDALRYQGIINAVEYQLQIFNNIILTVMVAETLDYEAAKQKILHLIKNPFIDTTELYFSILRKTNLPAWMELLDSEISKSEIISRVEPAKKLYAQNLEISTQNNIHRLQLAKEDRHQKIASRQKTAVSKRISRNLLSISESETNLILERSWISRFTNLFAPTIYQYVGKPLENLLSDSPSYFPEHPVWTQISNPNRLFAGRFKVLLVAAAQTPQNISRLGM
jgi:hypothetical protein